MATIRLDDTVDVGGVIQLRRTRQDRDGGVDAVNAHDGDEADQHRDDGRGRHTGGMSASPDDQEDQTGEESQIHAGAARTQRRLMFVNKERALGQLMAQGVTNQPGLVPQAWRRSRDEQTDDRGRYPDEERLGDQSPP